MLAVASGLRCRSTENHRNKSMPADRMRLPVDLHAIATRSAAHETPFEDCPDNASCSAGTRDVGERIRAGAILPFPPLEFPKQGGYAEFMRFEQSRP